MVDVFDSDGHRGGRGSTNIPFAGHGSQGCDGDVLLLLARDIIVVRWEEIQIENTHGNDAVYKNSHLETRSKQTIENSEGCSAVLSFTSKAQQKVKNNYSVGLLELLALT